MFDVSKIKFRLDDDGYVVAETKFSAMASCGLDDAVIYTIAQTYEALLGRKPSSAEVQAGLDLFEKQVGGSSKYGKFYRTIA